MKRKEFLKLFAASTAVVAVAPLAIINKIYYPLTEEELLELSRKIQEPLAGGMENRHDFLKQHPLTTEEAIKAYQDTGRLHWRNQIQTFREDYKIK